MLNSKADNLNKRYKELLGDLLANDSFIYEQSYKDEKLLSINSILTSIHRLECQEYRDFIDAFQDYQKSEIIFTPALPAQLFKEKNLSSIEPKVIYRTLESSGTSSNLKSKIYLDEETALNQRRVLGKILKDFFRKPRLPMLVIDSPPSAATNNFSASVAAHRGFSLISKSVTFLLDSNGQINFDSLDNFLSENKLGGYYIFGMTFNIYEYMLKKNIPRTFENGILIHGGGWKKLANLGISNDYFKDCLINNLLVSTVHNYYGMVEQVGTIYMECEEGYFHDNLFSQVNTIGCDGIDSISGGLIRLFSVLPKSYPGHNMLSDDFGFIVGKNSCKCGRAGTIFTISGRVSNSEVRGCSDAI